MVDQAVFRFSPLKGEALNLGTMGLDLDWRSIERRARKKLVQHYAESKPQILAAGFNWKRYFLEAELLEEIRRQSRLKFKELRKQGKGRGRKPAAVVAFLRSPDGRRAQIVMDRLIERLGDWETVGLCG